MSEYQATILWRRQANESFIDSKYSRAHTWEFDGGLIVPASSAVSSVPLPYSKPENVDPEEGFVAIVSSCHMLTFLFLAGKAKFVVDMYEDFAVGHMAKNARDKLAITRIVLAPSIEFSGNHVPTDADVRQLHHEAHEECYIASSVLTTIEVEGTWRHRS